MAGTVLTDTNGRKTKVKRAPFALDRRTLAFRFRRRLQSTKPGINRMTTLWLERAPPWDRRSPDRLWFSSETEPQP